GDSVQSMKTRLIASAAISAPTVATVPLPISVAGVKRASPTTSLFTTVKLIASAKPTASASRASAERPSPRAPRSCGVGARTRPVESAAPLRAEVPFGRVTLKSGFVALLGALEQLHWSGRHHRRNRMLVDQLRMRIAAQQHREIVEPSHDALQLHAIHEEDRHWHLVLADVIQEHVLYVLGFFSSHRFPLLYQLLSGPNLVGVQIPDPSSMRAPNRSSPKTGPHVHRYHNSVPWETRSYAAKAANPAQIRDPAARPRSTPLPDMAISIAQSGGVGHDGGAARYCR